MKQQISLKEKIKIGLAVWVTLLAAGFLYQLLVSEPSLVLQKILLIGYLPCWPLIWYTS